MVAENLLVKEYQSKEAKLFFLKQRADKVSHFISTLRSSKGKVYFQIMKEVTGLEALVTIQSFLLQLTLYCKKYETMQLCDILEVSKAYEALALYYNGKDPTGIITYLKEVKHLFELVKD